MPKHLLLVDGNSIANRAYYGGPRLTNQANESLTVLYTFFRILQRHIQEFQITHLAIAFDLPQKTFRHELYPSYKETRKSPDPDFLEQFLRLKSLLERMEIPVYSLPGYEADDIVGTMSRLAIDTFDHIYLLSGDRDYLQLVTDQVSLLYPKKAGALTIYDPKRVKEAYGSLPEHFIHLKALQGDSSDNIPGLAGVGPKTAERWLQTYPTIPELYEHFDELPLSAQKKLEGQEDFLKQMLELVTICCSAPIKPDWSETHLSPHRLQKIGEVLEQAELPQIARHYMEFAGDAGGLSSEPIESPQSAFNWARSLQPSDPSSLNEKNSLPPVADQSALNEWMKRILSSDSKILRWLWLCDPLKDSDSTKVSQEDLLAPPSVYAVDLVEKEILPLTVQGFLQLQQSYRSAGIHPGVFSLAELLQEVSSQADPRVWDALLTYYPLRSDTKVKSLQDLAYALQLNDVLAEELVKGDLFIRLTAAARLLQIALPQLRQEAETQGVLQWVEEVDQPLATVLQDMKETGVLFDRPLLLQTQTDLAHQLEDLEERIQTLAGQTFNLSSPSQLAVVLYEKLQLPAKKTKTGYSTNADWLEQIADRHPIVPLLLEYRKLNKLQTTYVKGLLKAMDKHGRVYSQFLQTSTNTGRLSSTKPNLQNMPIRSEEGHVFRQALIAAPDCVLVDADYSQIELRLLAHLSNDPRLCEAFSQGIDIHAQTAAELFDVPLPAVTAEQRRVGKVINFSIIYGVTGYGLAQDLGVNVEEANRYIDRYFARYPAVEAYLKQIEEDAYAKGYAETYSKRRRILPELQNRNRMVREFGVRAAKNAPIQGTAADLIRKAMVSIYNRLRAEGYKTKMILQIHDELLLEAPIEESEAVCKLLQEEMEQVVQLTVPLIAEASLGVNWLEAK